MPQDAGPYRCRVDFWKAATRNYKIYLQLVEQAESVRIYDGGDVEGGKGRNQIKEKLQKLTPYFTLIKSILCMHFIFIQN